MKTFSRKTADHASSAIAYQGMNTSTSAFPDLRPEAILQRQLQGMANSYSGNTGLPPDLKSGIEYLSGYSLNDVNVHYNSSKPAQLKARAFAQGTDIYLGPGQEKYLPHEAWHVVQQKQNRVNATSQLKGFSLNDDSILEKEADQMGAQAMQFKSAGLAASDEAIKTLRLNSGNRKIVQRAVGFEFETSKWVLEKPDTMSWNPDSKLVKGDNWQVSPDDIQDDNNLGKIEFKTGPIDVDSDGDLDAILNRAFDSLIAYCDHLSSLREKTLLPNAQQRFKKITVTPGGPLTAKPQITGGIRPDLLIDLLQHATQDGLGNLLLPIPPLQKQLRDTLDRTLPQIDSRSKQSREYWGTVSLIASYFRFIHDELYAPANREKAQLEKNINLIKQQLALVGGLTEERQQLLNNGLKIKWEEIMFKYRPEYAKAVAAFLPRLRFRKLPGITEDTFIGDVINTVGLSEVTGDSRLFPFGVKGNPEFDLTIRQYIEDIQAENPAAASGEIWSFKEIKSDDVGHDDQKGPGILFELRAFKNHVPYTSWKRFAKMYLQYFRKLNEIAKPENP